MSGILGIVSLSGRAIPRLDERLVFMSRLLRHRGKPVYGRHSRNNVGLAELGGRTSVRKNDDLWTGAVVKDGAMRAFWDEKTARFVCKRDGFGAKPVYYAVVDEVLYFASECKALLPFTGIKTDDDALREYLVFQFCLHGRTLFKGISELLPNCALTVSGGDARVNCLPRPEYRPDFDHTERYFCGNVRRLLRESVERHVQKAPKSSWLGVCVSGGLDSSAVASVAAEHTKVRGYVGRFPEHGPAYDESEYAAELAKTRGFPLERVEITCDDFLRDIERVIYHLDYPVAGVGAFSQYEVAKVAAGECDMVLTGEGGDELFGGYARYLMAYFEQCVKAAIEGTLDRGNFVVDYLTILPNLDALRAYKPALQQFWRAGLFESMANRYYALLDRSRGLGNAVRWNELDGRDPRGAFTEVFDDPPATCYFDRMSRFDLAAFVPALVHVDDRMTAAHGLDVRAPIFDAPLVDFATTIPADLKFRYGRLKHVWREAVRPLVPKVIADRRDKCGFATPFHEWLRGGARDFVHDIFNSGVADRGYVDTKVVLQRLEDPEPFDRGLWGLLSLELWHRCFHDRENDYTKLFTT